MREEICHFWLGTFPSEERVADYFKEVYDDEDEDREHTPLSAFARDQNEKWYDHDFLEYGYDVAVESVTQLVHGYSYHDQYQDELSRRAAELGLSRINMFAFISADQIDFPASAFGADYTLHYAGAIRISV